MEKIDPLTGEKFMAKRSNQRFATKANQIRFNNQKAREKRKVKGTLDKILDKNRNILAKQLSDKEEISLSRDYLLGAGFNFGCHTHSIRRDEKVFWCVYEYALETIGDRFKIFKHA